MTHSTGTGVQLIGIGAYAPPTVVSNDDISTLVETSDEWIASRTGIRTRHVVSKDETVADLAIAAGKEALKSAGIEGEEIDLIIVACSTPDTIYPATSCQVQHAIGANRAAGFDMALACTGFVYGITIAEQFLRAGTYKTALVIAADVHSRFVDWSDRNTCVLFGDGAGAAVLKATSSSEDSFLASDLRIDGAKGMELTLFVNSDNCPLVAPRTKASPYVYMNGREMFKFAVGVVPTSIKGTLAKAGVTMDDVDHLVLHQANIRIMQAMSEKLGVSEEKMVVNLDKYGNTSAASIPLALNEAVLSGRIKKGDLVVLCGFGAGVAWGTSVMKWSLVDKRLPENADAASKSKATVN